MKGIILAGGHATRLYPSTLAISKQMLPVYDKPLIYYPLSVLLLADMTDILVISSPRDIDSFRVLLGGGSPLGIRISYAVQQHPAGIAQALQIGEDFLAGDSVCLLLGDNVFYGQPLAAKVGEAASHLDGAHIFGYPVDKPQAFAVAELEESGAVISLEEKPEVPKSNIAVTGLYLYSNDVVKIAKSITPSARGELEITAVNSEYLSRGRLRMSILDEGVTWFDAGTHRDFLAASNFVERMQAQQGQYVACLEEIAYEKGLIGKEQVLRQAERMKASPYGQHLFSIIR